MGFFLTWLGLPTVKISAKSVTSIEQRSAGIGRGLRAMSPIHNPTGRSFSIGKKETDCTEVKIFVRLTGFFIVVDLPWMYWLVLLLFGFLTMNM